MVNISWESMDDGFTQIARLGKHNIGTIVIGKENTWYAFPRICGITDFAGEYKTQEEAREALKQEMIKWLIDAGLLILSPRECAERNPIGKFTCGKHI